MFRKDTKFISVSDQLSHLLRTYLPGFVRKKLLHIYIMFFDAHISKWSMVDPVAGRKYRQTSNRIPHTQFPCDTTVHIVNPLWRTVKQFQWRCFQPLKRSHNYDQNATWQDRRIIGVQSHSDTCLFQQTGITALRSMKGLFQSSSLLCIPISGLGGKIFYRFVIECCIAGTHSGLP